MKILIISPDGVGLDFAIRCQDAGHKVMLGLSKKCRHPRIGEGLVPRTMNWQDHMKWADLIFMTDNAQWQPELDRFFKEGYPILGTNPQSARLELDREFGLKILENCGIEVPYYQIFDDYDEAMGYVRKTKGRFVSKPCGDADKALSYVSHSPADLIYMLQRWKKASKLKDKFLLQEFIGGIEMGVTGWFGPHGWNSVFLENFEHKKLMNDDKGVNTGEMGTACKYVTESRLAQEMLMPITNALHALQFVGSCDMNVIIDERGQIWPLEFTIRPGWPLFYIQSYLHKGDPAEWMLALLHGEDRLKVNRNHAIGVVVTIPDFPYSRLTQKEVEGIPLYGVNQSNYENIRFGEVMAGSAPCMEGDNIVEKELLVSAGDYIACVVADGPNVHKAKHKAYEVVKELELPNSPMYRTDIGKRVMRQLPDLQEMGFAEEWEVGDEED